MIYTNGQVIKLKEKDICLEIIDSEIILDTEIYYTNDGSCYPLNYIEKSVDVEQYLETTINIISPFIVEVVEKQLEQFKKKDRNSDYFYKLYDDLCKLEKLQEKKLKKEKWNKVFNKLKKFFLLK